MDIQNTPTNFQLDSSGNLRHFLAIEGLGRQHLLQILDNAVKFSGSNGQRYVPSPLLKNKTIVNLFVESSTRTRSSFELAAKRLGADVLNFDINTSSTSKGETFLDTLYTLQAMGVDAFVIRHFEEGAPDFAAQHVAEPVAVINAGDGRHEHPTQAMLDIFTIQQHKPDFGKLSVAIVGDILHSRVAHSQILALARLGVPDIRIVGPKVLLPAAVNIEGVSKHNDLISGIKNVDVVIMLRLQHERMQEKLVPNVEEYFLNYGLTREKLKYAKADAIVMHPGPINRGIEIESAVADSPQSVILQQVKNGIAVRMAILVMLLEKNAMKNGYV